jgi:hypothetical protein
MKAGFGRTCLDEPTETWWSKVFCSAINPIRIPFKSREHGLSLFLA